MCTGGSKKMGRSRSGWSSPRVWAGAFQPRLGFLRRRLYPFCLVAIFWQRSVGPAKSWMSKNDVPAGFRARWGRVDTPGGAS